MRQEKNHYSITFFTEKTDNWSESDLVKDFLNRSSYFRFLKQHATDAADQSIVRNIEESYSLNEMCACVSVHAPELTDESCLSRFLTDIILIINDLFVFDPKALFMQYLHNFKNELFNVREENFRKQNAQEFTDTPNRILNNV